MAAYKDLVGQKITVVTSNPPELKQVRCGTIHRWSSGEV